MKSLKWKPILRFASGLTLIFLMLFVLIGIGGSHTLYLPIVTRIASPPYGVTMYEGALSEGALQLLKQAGCYYVTYMVHWSDIEPIAPSNGIHSYNWEKYDIEFIRLRGAGLEPFILFTSNPIWAASNPRGPVYNLQDLADVVSALAERYDADGIQDAPRAPFIRYWSLYQEPDSIGGWGHNGVGYAEMLRVVSPAIHKANPLAKVINGGLAFDYFEPSGPFVYNFLSNMLSQLSTYPGGITTYLDGMAFHYYKLLFPTIQEKAITIRQILSTYNVSHLPLICPEAGESSSPKWGTDELKQADYLKQLFTAASEIGISPIMWYKVYDDVWANSSQDTSRIYTTGLRRLDRSLKPSFFSFRELATFK